MYSSRSPSAPPRFFHSIVVRTYRWPRMMTLSRSQTISFHCKSECMTSLYSGSRGPVSRGRVCGNRTSAIRISIVCRVSLDHLQYGMGLPPFGASFQISASSYLVKK